MNAWITISTDSTPINKWSRARLSFMNKVSRTNMYTFKFLKNKILIFFSIKDTRILLFLVEIQWKQILLSDIYYRTWNNT